jgi:hypothetical protein
MAAPFGVVPLFEASSLKTRLGSQQCRSAAHGGPIWDLHLRQARRLLSASRRGGCFPTEDLGSFLGCRLRLAADHGGWCCLATTSAVWDIVGMTALAATTPGGDLACSGSWRGTQLGWVLWCSTSSKDGASDLT